MNRRVVYAASKPGILALISDRNSSTIDLNTCNNKFCTENNLGSFGAFFSRRTPEPAVPSLVVGMRLICPPATSMIRILGQIHSVPLDFEIVIDAISQKKIKENSWGFELVHGLDTG